jgi:hypothetical protein
MGSSIMFHVEPKIKRIKMGEHITAYDKNGKKLEAKRIYTDDWKDMLKSLKKIFYNKKFHDNNRFPFTELIEDTKSSLEFEKTNFYYKYISNPDYSEIIYKDLDDNIKTFLGLAGDLTAYNPYELMYMYVVALRIFKIAAVNEGYVDVW